MEKLTDLPEVGLIRLPMILDHFQISRSGWYEGMKAGFYPRPIKIGRKSLWPATQIRELLATLSKQND